MKPISEIERSLIEERLFVDPSSPTGLSRYKGGKAAGWLRRDRTGYANWDVQVGRRTYRAHRLVWFLATGTDCLDSGMEVDHIDRDATNNAIQNLRLASDSEQSKNQKKRSGTTSEHKFVRWHKKSGKWVAQYSRYWSDGRTVWVGSFCGEREAHYAALAHRLENHPFHC